MKALTTGLTMVTTTGLVLMAKGIGWGLRAVSEDSLEEWSLVKLHGDNLPGFL